VLAGLDGWPAHQLDDAGDADGFYLKKFNNISGTFII